MRAAATALALVLLPGLARGQSLEVQPDTQGRVTAAVALGGGYRSDLFLGAGLASQGVADAAPSLNLDLSATPWLKLYAELDADAEHAFQSGAGAYGLYGDVMLQFRPVPWLYPEVLLAGEQDWYLHLAAPSDPTNPSAPPATNSHLLTGGLGLRSVQGALELRVLAVASQRVSTGEDTFFEYPLTLTAYAGYQALSRLKLGAQYRIGQTRSPTDALNFWGQELSLSAALSLGPGPLLRARAGVRRNAFDQGGVTWAPLASLAVAQPVWGAVSVEAAYRFEQVSGDGYATPATMHMAYLGVRAEGGPWRF